MQASGRRDVAALLDTGLTHGRGFFCCSLSVLAHVHHLRWNDVPLQQLRDKGLLLRAERPRVKLIFANKIAVLYHDGGPFDGCLPGLGEDSELARDDIRRSEHP